MEGGPQAPGRAVRDRESKASPAAAPGAEPRRRPHRTDTESTRTGPDTRHADFRTP